jgi:galactokinase
MGLKILNCLGRQESFLCNVSPAEYRHLRKMLPVKTSGKRFQELYGDTSDAATSIDPDTVYSVRGCTEHPIYENYRAGKLMYASHWSYGRRCGLGCKETDILVDLVREMGQPYGLYGAKITGGGSGGTVSVLAKGDVGEALDQIKARYYAATGIKTRVFTGSSPGAVHFGHREIIF